MREINIRSFRKVLRRFDRLNEILNKSCCRKVTWAQCHTLLEIEELREATTIQLAGNLMLDKSTLSRTIDSLVNDGLVLRKQHTSDRRFVTLTLSKEGSKVCNEINKENDNTYKSILSPLSNNEAHNLIMNFEKLISLMKDFNKKTKNKNACCN